VRYLIDSDWLVDVLIGVPAAVAAIERLSDQDLGVSIVSYGEIFEGAFGAPDPRGELAHFRAFLDRFTTVPLSDPIMEVFARIRSHLRRQGQLISDMDLLIAATSIYHDLNLVTRNRRHFERIPELKLLQAS
jgi:tRNA(fMet)-specific endonuclease VapC